MYAIGTDWNYHSVYGAIRNISIWLLLSSGAKLLGFVCVEVLRPSQPNGVMLSMVSLPNDTFTGQA